MTAQAKDNPWGLTRAETRTMDAICALGTAKLCAKALGVSHRTVECHQQAIKKKMPYPLTVRTAKWYGWRNGIEWKEFYYEPKPEKPIEVKRPLGAIHSKHATQLFQPKKGNDG